MAIQLCGGAGGARFDDADVTYALVVFERHETVRVDGPWLECFNPTAKACEGTDPAWRRETLSQIPAVAEMRNHRPI